MLLEITESNYELEVEQSGLPVIIDFYAMWCGPCRVVKPVFIELAQEYAGRVKFAFINIDQQRDLAIKYGISSIPSFVMVKGGEVVGKVVGGRGYDELKMFVEDHL